MPIFSARVLQGGPETLGFLMTASGVGAFAGAIYLASRSSVLGLGRVIPIATAMAGIGLIAFSFSRLLWLSMLLAIFAAFGMMVAMAGSNTVLQTIVDEDKRGRVMSLYTTSFMGALPLGSFLAGSVADFIGAQYTVSIGGVFCIIGAALFARQHNALRDLIRPVYARMGILGGEN